MSNNKILILFCVTCLLALLQATAQSKLYEFDTNHLSTRWASPENPDAKKGTGGLENNGAKGRAFSFINAGETKPLLDVQGTGIINRIWITVDDRTPEMLRSLRFEIYWDNETKPAVQVPFGDFFGVGLGKTTAFENALFASPEGRSFECLIQMPFKKAAKLVVVNESTTRLDHIFYDVDFQYLKTWQPNFLYFHTYWHRDTATTLAKDFELLPHVTGKGRYLGVNIGINANPIYGNAWWGEGEVKMYFDGDGKLPTIAGTGTEDYVGTGWGQGRFANNYTGCLLAEKDLRQWAYYRYHVLDPILFGQECRVTLQQIGGDDFATVAAMQKAGVPLIPVTVDNDGNMVNFYKHDSTVQLAASSPTKGWVNFYRVDDVSATAYFYLDKPSSDLPALQNVAIRKYNLKSK